MGCFAIDTQGEFAYASAYKKAISYHPGTKKGKV